jgi:pyridinium-3,5-biscarboxylic acid mononucleotide sulfurtransferase
MIEVQNFKSGALKEILAHMGSALVSFSGGIDSALLLHVASEVLGERVKALTFVSPIFPSADSVRAENFTAILKVAHIKMPFEILSQDAFLINDGMRCRVCKTKMVEELKKEAARQGLEHIIDGANQDDLKDYRPGLDVTRRAGIQSPLMEAGFTKYDIRREAKDRNIEFWNAASSACLASRIAYGTQIRKADLAMIDQAEAFLRDSGFAEVRIRYHPPIARIEVSPEKIHRVMESPLRERVIEHLKRLGFAYITLDLSGYRRGSMNELLF